MIATRSPGAPLRSFASLVSPSPSPRPVLRDALRRLVAGICALALSLGTALQPALAQNNLPALGDSDSADFSVGAERKIGDEIMREIRRDPDYIDDPLLLEYLQSVWEPLVAAGAPPRQHHRRHRPALRLGAVPRARPQRQRVRAARRLRRRAPRPDRHHRHARRARLGARRTSCRTSRSATSRAASPATRARSLVGLAALILGVLAAARSNSPDAVNAVVAGSQAATIQGQLNFSRDMEREADRIGFQVMTAAGFAPGGMAAMFEKMDVSTRLNDYGGFPYLRTHPLTIERIGEARSRAQALASAAPPRVSVLEHVAAQARARVLMDSRVDALRRWQAATPTSKAARPPTSCSTPARARWRRRCCATGRAPTRHSPGRWRSPARARTAARAPSAPWRCCRRSRCSSAARPRKAGEAMRPYAGDASRPVMLLAAQVALAETPAVTPDSAALKTRAGELQTWVALHPDDALAWGALGQTWARLGLPLRSLRAEAESRYALGDLIGAVDRLRAGQRFARSGGSVDFIDASVIDSRLRDIEGQRRQIEADRRAGR